MMSQQAPAKLIRISRYLKGVGRYPNQPVLSSDLGRLVLLLSASVLLTFWLTTSQVDANILFQSPESPPAQPPVEQPPAVEPPAEQQPAVEPPVEQQPEIQPPVEQPPLEQPPAEQPADLQSPAAQPPVEQPPDQPPPAEAAPPVEQTGVEPAAPAEPSQPGPVSRRREEAPVDETAAQGPVNFILDQAEFIDTVVISGAYIWLCCGVGTLLLVPLALLFVYIRGRSKIIREG